MSEKDWAGKSLPAMWASAQGADTNMAWEQVRAWQQTYELFLYHRGRLLASKEELRAAWPPERSPAAAAFINYLDGLMTAMSRAAEDALENRNALAGLLTSLTTSKADMAKLKETWDEREVEAANRAQNLSNVLPHSAGANWQEELNEQGRKRMTQGDQEVLESYRRMNNVYPFGRRIEGGDPRPFDDGTPGSGSATGTPNVGSNRSNASATPVTVSSPDTIDALVAASVAGSTGSILAGLPDSAAAGVGSPVRLGGSQPHVPTSIPDSGVSAIVSGAGRGARSLGARSGVIGPAEHAYGTSSRPAAGPSGRTGGWMPGRLPGVRVNPVGGELGGSLTREGNGSIREQAGSGHAPMGTPVAGRGGSSRSNERRRTPPDLLHWEVAEGGPAVIEPRPEQPFVLGPGVIGDDR